jgi:hypothetical protein
MDSPTMKIQNIDPSATRPRRAASEMGIEPPYAIATFPLRPPCRNRIRR